MSEGWLPIPEHELDLSAEAFRAVLAAERELLDAETRAVYDRYAVEPLRAPKSWDSGDGAVTTPVWIVARSGEVVLAYDEVEDEYGTGRLGLHGVEDFGTYGERLRWTLLHFPEGGAQRLGNAAPVPSAPSA